jgi:outer membrane protein, multidrug efflux system
MRKTLLYLLVIVLCSCDVKPRYIRPDEEPPITWRLETNEMHDAANFRWWEQFGDPVLNELILRALDNNNDLKVAAARVYEFYNQYYVALSFLFPEVVGDGHTQRTEYSSATPLAPPSKFRFINDYQATLNLFWELDFWGRLRNASEAAYAEFLSQVYNRRTVVLTLVSNVASNYVLLRQYDKQLEISKETLVSRQEAYKIALARFESGQTSEMEVKQAISEVDVAAVQIRNFEILVFQQEDLLSVLLGENPHSIIRGAGLDELNMPLSVPVGLPSDLIEQRPDITSAEQKLIAANALIGFERANFLPKFSLTGYYGSESSDLHDLLTGKAVISQIAANMRQLIFDAGRTLHRVQAADYVKEEAIYTYLQTILVAFQQVNDALIFHKKSLEIEEIDQERVATLKDYLRLAKLQYDNGHVDYLTYLDAERNLFRAQLELAQDRGNTFISLIDLYKALGGGWVIDADYMRERCPTEN